jgi:hypothetical protein
MATSATEQRGQELQLARIGATSVDRGEGRRAVDSGRYGGGDMAPALESGRR